MKKNIKYTFPLYVSILVIIGLGIVACNDDDFTNLGDTIAQLTIADINPTTGDIGTSVTVTGTNFSAVPSNNKVSVNGIFTKVTTASASSLTFEVPEEATTGNIIISHGNFTANGPVFTIVEVPTISNISPTSGPEGETVIITGTKFSAIALENSVSFNGTAATVTSATATTITTSIPVGATTGAITVQVNGQTVIGPEFTVTLPVPTIATIDPTIGIEGDMVTITGTNFSIIPAENGVSFNGTAATATASTNTTITVTVPIGVTTGPIDVTVNGQTATGPVFTVNNPKMVTVFIDSSSDDAEEGINGDTIGDMDLTSSDLEFGEIEGSTRGIELAGLRFNGINIPQGANVTSASIQFIVDESRDPQVPVVLEIFGEAVDNSTTFVEDLFNISTRPLTTAMVSWSIPVWPTVGEAGANQTTINLSSIIQEIINRPGWVAGNSLNIILKPDATTIGNAENVGRTAEAFDEAPNLAASLTIMIE